MLKMAFLSGAILVALVYGQWVSQVIQIPGEVTFGVPKDATEQMPWLETVKFIYDLQFNRHPISYLGLRPTNGSEHVAAVQWSKSGIDVRTARDATERTPWLETIQIRLCTRREKSSSLGFSSGQQASLTSHSVLLHGAEKEDQETSPTRSHETRRKFWRT